MICEFDLGTISEPPPRWGHFSAPVEGVGLCMWGGCTKLSHTKGNEPLSDVYTFDPRHRLWRAHSTTDPPCPYLYEGACASDGHHLYLYGGYDGSEFRGSLHQLNCKTWQWTELRDCNDSDGPKRKKGCGMVAYEDQLVLFGGYGILSDCPHPKPEFTNDLHVFSLKEGKFETLIAIASYGL